MVWTGLRTVLSMSSVWGAYTSGLKAFSVFESFARCPALRESGLPWPLLLVGIQDSLLTLLLGFDHTAIAVVDRRYFVGICVCIIVVWRKRYLESPRCTPTPSKQSDVIQKEMEWCCNLSSEKLPSEWLSAENRFWKWQMQSRHVLCVRA